MRALVPFLLAFLCASTYALPQAPPPVNDNPSNGVQDSDPKAGSRHRVKPGTCHTNGDGVKVCNTGDAGDGDFMVDPKTGVEGSATEVDAKNDAEGTVDGIDSNDTVNCANGSNVTITGTGGTVNAGNGSNGSVQNTNAPGGGNITVNIGGGSIEVPPGSTIPFSG